jgi:peptide deformylase
LPPAPILRYPDPRLKQRCEPLDLDRDAEPARRVAAALVDTMRGQPRCVGLAAPQIGELVRIVVVDVTGHPKARSCHGLLALVNPTLAAGEDEEIGREGCLSIPDLTGNVVRAVDVTVEAVTVDGEPVTVAADAFEARVLQHELDHLDGILFLDRLLSKQDLFRRRQYG